MHDENEPNSRLPYPPQQRTTPYPYSRRTSRRSAQRSIPYLWAAVLILLLLNIVLLYGLNLARLMAIEALTRVEATLDKLAGEVVVYDVEINQPVPIKADVPFSRTLDIPLDTVIPIDQVLTVPFGGVDLDLPINTDFPIKTVIPVTLDETISVDTAVQLNTTIPVEIEIARTPLIGYLTQTRQHITQIKNRLTWQDEPPPLLESANVSAAASSEVQSESGEGYVAADAAAAGTGSVEGSAPVSSVPVSAEVRSTAGEATACTHTYMPLQPGTTWTYNSPKSSNTQRVDTIIDGRIYLSTQYEGRDITFTVDCLDDGMGLSFLGDMRRITEIGDLKFSQPQGTFLTDPDTMAGSGNSWTQAFKVTGTIPGRQGNRAVVGRITKGQVQAANTSTGFETVDTPLGPQKALRVEQVLDFDLQISFDLAGQIIPAKEKINFSNVYWFVEKIGLVKMHWQGGSLEQSFELAGTPFTQRTGIPELPEDELVFVCIMLDDGAFDCKRIAGVSQSNLTTPADSELDIPAFIFPDGINETPSISQEESQTEGGEDSDGNTPKTKDSNQPTPTPTAGPVKRDGDLSELLRYASSVESLAGQISKAAGPFQKAVLAYRDNSITIDEFRAEFEKFGPKARGLIQQTNRLSPPKQAANIHADLSYGLAQCDQGIDMLDEWLDSFDDSLKQPAVVLVTACIQEVTAAGEALEALIAVEDGN